MLGKFFLEKKGLIVWSITFFISIALLFWWSLEMKKAKNQINKVEEEMAQKEKLKEEAFLKVYYLEISRGDAIFLNYSDKYQILIDGGDTPKQVSRYLPLIMPKGDNEIELVMVTHSHQDHHKGIPKVLEKYNVKQFISNGEEVHEDILALLEKQKIKPEVFKQGDSIKVDELFSLRFIGPGEEVLKRGDPDNKSLSFRTNFGKNTFIFLGDSKFTAEKQLLESNQNLQADFWKVGHHGYNDASSKKFIEAISPKFAFITPAGSPEGRVPPTIKRLEQMEITNFELGKTGSKVIECFGWNNECEVK